MEDRCLNYKDLAIKLGRSESTMQKEWRMYPHFFVGRGRNLKSARFDFEEILSHLKTTARGVQIPPPKKPSKPWAAHNQSSSTRFDVLRNIKNK
jgi:hypothetical protein